MEEVTLIAELGERYIIREVNRESLIDSILKSEDKDHKSPYHRLSLVEAWKENKNPVIKLTELIFLVNPYLEVTK